MAALLGIILHAIGGFAAGSFYAPYKKVKNWAWEIYWLLGGIFAWIIMPWLVSYMAIPNLYSFMSSLTLGEIFWPYFFGVLWGVGGLTFGLTMRYLGMSLGMAIALGLTASFGTLIPPIYYGQLGDLFNSVSGLVTLFGILVSLVGITITGKAGIKKDNELSTEQKQETISEFNLKKGIWVALFAGIMSASFAFGIAAGKSISAKAIEMGATELFSNSPLFIIIMAGGFTTNLLWCLFLIVKNKTLKDFVKTKDTPILNNYIFSAMGGIIWYFQFMFYGMGTTKMGDLDFASWSIHMSFIIIFSNMWGMILKEWKGAGKSTMRFLYIGLGILILSTFIIGFGNYLQGFY